MWYQRQRKHLADLFQVNEERLGFWLCSKHEEEDDANVHKAIQHSPISLPFAISDWTGYFDTWRRGEFPAAPSGASVWEARCKEQCWRKAIYNPTTILPSLTHSTPLAEVLLRDKNATDLRRKTRRQILESSRRCWDIFSSPVENPVFLAPQVRQMLCLFLQFQNNHGQLKLQDNIPSCCSSSPNQHKFSMNLARWVWPSQINKVKDNPQRDCILCSLNRSSISTLLFNIKH